MANITYRPGSIYQHISNNQAFLTGLTIFMIGALLTGLVRTREAVASARPISKVLEAI